MVALGAQPSTTAASTHERTQGDRAIGVRETIVAGSCAYSELIGGGCCTG